MRQILSMCAAVELAESFMSAADPLRKPRAPGVHLDPRVSYAEARTAAVADFERRYLSRLLAAHGGNVSAAARAAGMHRVYLHELIRRRGLRG
jgi:transcriptional regulator with GAF, ATPase, and Fis domain